MDLPHIHLKGRTGIKINCTDCKKVKDFDTTGKTKEQVDAIIEAYPCPCQKKVRHFNCPECASDKFNVILSERKAFDIAKIKKIFCCNCGLGIDNK